MPLKRHLHLDFLQLSLNLIFSRHICCTLKEIFVISQSKQTCTLWLIKHINPVFSILTLQQGFTILFINFSGFFSRTRIYHLILYSTSPPLNFSTLVLFISFSPSCFWSSSFCSSSGSCVLFTTRYLLASGSYSHFCSLRQTRPTLRYCLIYLLRSFSSFALLILPPWPIFKLFFYCISTFPLSYIPLQSHSYLMLFLFMSLSPLLLHCSLSESTQAVPLILINITNPLSSFLLPGFNRMNHLSFPQLILNHGYFAFSDSYYYNIFLRGMFPWLHHLLGHLYQVHSINSSQPIMERKVCFTHMFNVIRLYTIGLSS